MGLCTIPRRNVRFFWHLHMSLLTSSYVSFDIFTCLFWHFDGSALSQGATYDSFDIFICLFWHLHMSLLTSSLVSFDTLMGLHYPKAQYTILLTCRHAHWGHLPSVCNVDKIRKYNMPFDFLGFFVKRNIVLPSKESMFFRHRNQVACRIQFWHVVTRVEVTCVKRIRAHVVYIL